jgi:hypothetical protein
VQNEDMLKQFDKELDLMLSNFDPQKVESETKSICNFIKNYKGLDKSTKQEKLDIIKMMYIQINKI